MKLENPRKGGGLVKIALSYLLILIVQTFHSLFASLFFLDTYREIYVRWTEKSLTTVSFA